MKVIQVRQHGGESVFWGLQQRRKCNSHTGSRLAKALRSQRNNLCGGEWGYVGAGRAHLFLGRTDGETDEGTTRVSIIIWNAPTCYDAAFCLNTTGWPGHLPRAAFGPAASIQALKSLLRRNIWGSSTNPSPCPLTGSWLMSMVIFLDIFSAHLMLYMCELICELGSIVFIICLLDVFPSVAWRTWK